MSVKEKTTTNEDSLTEVEEETTRNDESPTEPEESTQSYEVGYGKPPTGTRFRKGASGNPSGRPKKSADFDTELLKESQTLITITDKGKRKRISKFQGIIKQLHNKALTGDLRASRLIIERYQEAAQRASQSAAEEAKDLDRLTNANELTDEELSFIILGGDPEEIVRRRPGTGTKKGKTK